MLSELESSFTPATDAAIVHCPAEAVKLLQRCVYRLPPEAAETMGRHQTRMQIVLERYRVPLMAAFVLGLGGIGFAAVRHLLLDVHPGDVRVAFSVINGW